MVKVGIIANPVSARDIRRVISHAGSISINDRANIVMRLLAGLARAGVDEAIMMPDSSGLRQHLTRSLERAEKMGEGVFPRLRFLEMEVTSGPDDSARAAFMMREEDISAVLVLGGDGTNRLVAMHSGGVPMAGISTGTNNAFPELREPTITGLAVGLAACGRIPAKKAWRFNKWLEVRVNDRREIALVDVAIVEEQFIGARAIWKTDGFRDLFVTFGMPQSIGMSSIAGLLDPVSREAPEGRHVRLCPAKGAARKLLAPIAPGLLEEVGIDAVERIAPDALLRPSVSTGSVALDGERELTFREGDHVTIRLARDAFRTIDIPACMAFAASAGLFITETSEAHQKGGHHEQPVAVG